MAKQVINIGATPNDKSGDPLRTAFIKVNDNFTELYNSTGADVQIPIQTGQEGKFLRTNGSTLSWVAITASNQLVNGNKTVSLGSDGNLTFPDGSFQSTAFVGLASTAQDLYKNEEIFIGIGDGLTTRKQWSFDPSGTITVPSPTSTVFTLTFAESNYVPTISKPTLTLTSTPWELHGEYAYTTDGRVAPLALDNIFPVLVNPGYTSGDAFTFDESIHGFAGYTLIVTLTNVVLPGGAGWTANIEMNDPPVYPSTINSLGAIKVTSNQNSWTFGTDGTLTLPGGTDTITNINDGLDLSILGMDEETVLTVNLSRSGALTVPSAINFNFIGTNTGIIGTQPDEIFIAGAPNKAVHIAPNDGANGVFLFGNDGSLATPGTISAKTTLALETTDIDILYGVYQDSVALLDAAFAADEYTGQGYPASKNSFEALGRAKALNPLIPDMWITIASNLRNAYFAWAAAQVTLTVDGGGFTIANGGGTSWRLDEATGLRFPNNTYQRTAWTGSVSGLLNNGHLLALDSDGNLTFPDNTVQTTAYTGGGIVGITSSSTSTYNVSTSFTPPNGDWNYANWDDVRDIGGFTPNALFYSVLKSLNPGDTVVVNGTDSYIIDHVTTGVGNNGYFHILTTTDSLNRFAQITSLTFDIVDVTVSGNVTVESTLIIDGNIQLKAGADIKNSTGDSALVSREPSFEIVISSFTAQAGRRYGINTTAGAITAYLPQTPVAGDAIFFVDSHGTFFTNNLTIDGNSGWPYAKTIMGQATQVITTDGLSFGLFYNGTEWRFYN